MVMVILYYSTPLTTVFSTNTFKSELVNQVNNLTNDTCNLEKPLAIIFVTDPKFIYKGAPPKLDDLYKEYDYQKAVAIKTSNILDNKYIDKEFLTKIGRIDFGGYKILMKVINGSYVTAITDAKSGQMNPDISAGLLSNAVYRLTIAGKDTSAATYTNLQKALSAKSAASTPSAAVNTSLHIPSVSNVTRTAPASAPAPAALVTTNKVTTVPQIQQQSRTPLVPTAVSKPQQPIQQTQVVSLAEKSKTIMAEECNDANAEKMKKLEEISNAIKLLTEKKASIEKELGIQISEPNSESEEVEKETQQENAMTKGNEQVYYVDNDEQKATCELIMNQLKFNFDTTAPEESEPIKMEINVFTKSKKLKCISYNSMDITGIVDNDGSFHEWVRLDELTAILFSTGLYFTYEPSPSDITMSGLSPKKKLPQQKSILFVPFANIRTIGYYNNSMVTIEITLTQKSLSAADIQKIYNQGISSITEGAYTETEIETIGADQKKIRVAVGKSQFAIPETLAKNDNANFNKERITEIFSADTTSGPKPVKPAFYSTNSSDIDQFERITIKFENSLNCEKFISILTFLKHEWNVKYFTAIQNAGVNFNCGHVNFNDIYVLELRQNEAKNNGVDGGDESVAEGNDEVFPDGKTRDEYEETELLKILKEDFGITNVPADNMIMYRAKRQADLEIVGKYGLDYSLYM